jgi:hypothetical protein
LLENLDLLAVDTLAMAVEMEVSPTAAAVLVLVDTVVMAATDHAIRGAEMDRRGQAAVAVVAVIGFAPLLLALFLGLAAV